MKLRLLGALCACVFVSTAPQIATGGTLLADIDKFLAGQYPVATAYLALYDSSGTYIGRQRMDATGLLSAGSINSGTEILFNGSLTFPDLYPLTAGGTGGLFASVHDFSVDLNTATNSSTDLITVQIDWTDINQSISENWGLLIGDDFENNIAYYIYEGNQPQSLSYGSARFSLEFADGIAPVPLPAAVWLFGTGLLGLIGIARRSKQS